MKSIKNKTILMIVGVLLLSIAVAGGTYAYLTRSVNLTNENHAINTECFLVDYDTQTIEDNVGANLISSIDTFNNITDSGNGMYKVDYTKANTDTNMKINANTNIVNGKTYTLLFNVEGLSVNDDAKFGFYYSKNGTNGIWHSKQITNGLNKYTFVYEGNTNSYLVLDDTTKNGTEVFTMSNFILYEQSQDITGTLFPSATINGGLSGKVGLKINSSCNMYGTGALKLHVNSGTNPTLTTSVASYCQSRKTLEKISGISTESACTTAGGRWMGYGDSYCENPNTLERMKDYKTSSDCTSNGGTWTSGGSPLKYAVYDTNNNLMSAGHITSSNIGGDITLKDDILISNAQEYYYIYVWLDGYLTDNTFSNLPFSGYISAEAIQNNDVEAVNLPNEYQRVYYLKSTGTQFIDTGYIPKVNTTLELALSFEGAFKNINTYGGGSVLFNALNQQYQINFGAASPQPYTLFIWINGNVVPGNSETIVINESILRNRNTLVLGGDNISYGTVSRTITPKVVDSTTSMKLFGKSSTDIFTSYDMLVYDLKMYESGNLLRHYVPCYRKSDSVRGLFDVLNNQFYTNAGSGTFETGPEI